VGTSYQVELLLSVLQHILGAAMMLFATIINWQAVAVV
jgi:hypothetical protein